MVHLVQSTVLNGSLNILVQVIFVAFFNNIVFRDCSREIPRNNFIPYNFDHKKADEAQCKHCPKILLCKGGSTVGLKNHLEKIQDIVLSKEEEPSNKKRCVQSTIDSMTKKVSLGERLAYFAAIDGFSLNAITKSNQFVSCFVIKATLYQNQKQIS